jgi:hypothetical protein
VIGAIVVGGNAFLQHDKFWPIWAFFPLILLFFFVSRPMQRRRVRQWHKTAGEVNQRVHWEFTDEKIIQTTPKSASEFDWTYVSKVIQRPNGFLMFNPHQQYFWLSRASLVEPADFEPLAELFKSKVADFKILR